MTNWRLGASASTAAATATWGLSRGRRLTWPPRITWIVAVRPPREAGVVRLTLLAGFTLLAGVTLLAGLTLLTGFTGKLRTLLGALSHRLSGRILAMPLGAAAPSVGLFARRLHAGLRGTVGIIVELFAGAFGGNAWPVAIVAPATPPVTEVQAWLRGGPRRAFGLVDIRLRAPGRRVISTRPRPLAHRWSWRIRGLRAPGVVTRRLVRFGKGQRDTGTTHEQARSHDSGGRGDTHSRSHVVITPHDTIRRHGRRAFDCRTIGHACLLCARMTRF